jgi:hypothetical protein
MMAAASFVCSAFRLVEGLKDRSCILCDVGVVENRGWWSAVFGGAGPCSSPHHALHTPFDINRLLLDNTLRNRAFRVRIIH